MIKPVLLSVSLAAVVAVPTACDVATEPEEKEDLHYELVRFHEAAVPGVIQESGEATLEILSGTVVLTPEGACRSETQWRRTVAGETTTGQVQLTCTWSGSGSVLTLRWDHASETTGTTESSLLTATLPMDLPCVADTCPTQWTATYVFVPM